MTLLQSLSANTSKTKKKPTRQKMRQTREAKQLHIGSLPKDIKEEELKTLSPDIITVNIKTSHFSDVKFGFVRFVSKEKAEENYKLLQQKKLRGQPIKVNFYGTKRHGDKEKDVAKPRQKGAGPKGTSPIKQAHVKVSFGSDDDSDEEEPEKATNTSKTTKAKKPSRLKMKRTREAKQLHMGNLPKDVKEEELKTLSPDIITVNIKSSKKHRDVKFCYVRFASGEKAKENYKLLQQKKLRGQPINVTFNGTKRHVNKEKDDEAKIVDTPAKPEAGVNQSQQETPSSIKKKRKRKSLKSQSNQAAKRARDEESDEDSSKLEPKLVNSKDEAKIIDTPAKPKTDLNQSQQETPSSKKKNKKRKSKANVEGNDNL